MVVKHAVFKLLDDAQSRGEALPSLRVLRARVGSGSLTTISQAVKEWRLAKLVEHGQMPEAFSAEQESMISRAVWQTVMPMLVKRISEIQDQANHRIDVERAETEQLMVVAQETLAEAERKVSREALWREQIDRLKERNTQLETMLSRAERELGRAQNEILTVREEGKQEQQMLLAQISQTQELTERLIATLGDRVGCSTSTQPKVSSAPRD